MRAASLLDKAAERGFAAGALAAPGTEAERRLMLSAQGFADAVALSVDKRAPNALCEWAFVLAQEFNSFYQACHILSESDEGLRGARLALVDLVLRQLDLTFSLLGITRPKRM